jgi:hypothetical protein
MDFSSAWPRDGGNLRASRGRGKRDWRCGRAKTKGMEDSGTDCDEFRIGDAHRSVFAPTIPTPICAMQTIEAHDVDHVAFHPHLGEASGQRIACESHMPGTRQRWRRCADRHDGHEAMSLARFRCHDDGEPALHHFGRHAVVVAPQGFTERGVEVDCHVPHRSGMRIPACRTTTNWRRFRAQRTGFPIINCRNSASSSAMRSPMRAVSASSR